MADVTKMDPDVDFNTPATPEEGTEVSPTPESSNGTSPSVSQEPEEDVTTLKEKYSQSSKEARRLKEDLESTKRELEQRDQVLLKQVTKSREIFTDYVDSLNITPREREHYMNVYDTEYAASSDESAKKEDSPAIPQVQPMSPERERWMTKMDQEESEKIAKQREATKEFYDKSENRNLSRPVQQAILATASMLDEEHGYSPQEALNIARRRILEPETLEDAGYANGVRDAYRSGVSRNLSGGRSNLENVVKLPPKDESFVAYEISKRKLSGDKAQEFREKYVERLAKRS